MTKLKALGLLALVLFSFGSGYYIMGLKHDKVIAVMKRTWEKERNQINEAAHERYVQFEEKKSKELNDYFQIISQDKIATDNISRIVDRMQRDIAKVPARIADAPRSSINEFTIVQGELLGDCTKEYLRMAGEAKQNAANARLIFNAWPK